MAKETQPLFKGMTRPAMIFGVPMTPLIIVLGVIASISVLYCVSFTSTSFSSSSSQLYFIYDIFSSDVNEIDMLFPDNFISIFTFPLWVI